MKNIGLIALVALLLAGCEKKYCWDCENTTTLLMTSPAGDSALVKTGEWEQHCEKTEEEAQQLQQDMTRQTTTQEGGYTTHKTVNYRCQKAE